MPIDREQAKRLLRRSMDEWVSLGNPTEQELDDKIAEVEALDSNEKKRVMRQVSPPTIEDLDERLDRLESSRGTSSGGQASNNNPLIANYELANDQQLTVGTTATVLFSTALTGSSSLSSLGLSLSNGVFTATRSNVFLVAYQLRFSGDTNSTGYRQGSISIGTDFFARHQIQTLTVATHVSGCYPIILGRGDSFSIKAFTSGNASLVEAGTKLAIMEA